MAVPKAILFDLDDTLISAYARPEAAWQAVLAQVGELLGPATPERAHAAIVRCADEFWRDPERHKYWRQRLAESRRVIVADAARALAAQGEPSWSEAASLAIADRFTAYREAQLSLFPGSLHTLDTLRARGVRLALVTNGAAATQRPKVERFDLARRFDHVQIEGEVGFGKPEPRAYEHALAALAVTPEQAWMVGDNLEWEVAAPQRMGIFAVWHDREGRGVPADRAIHPDRVITAIEQVLAL